MIDSPSNLTEQLLNLVERIAVEMRALYNAVTSKISKQEADDSYLGKGDKAISASNADLADKASKDASGNDIEATYATKPEVNAKAPINHADSATTYGIGNKDVYGHIKLSDSTSSTSTVTGGVAATPAAVKAAYDLANKALPKTGGTVTGATTFSGNVTVNGTLTNNALDLKLNAKAPLASPVFTGSPKAPTPTEGNSSTQIATTAFVMNAVANKTAVGSAETANKDSAGNVITATYATKSELSSKAPVLHKSTSNMYGAGSLNEYGHVKLLDDTDASYTASEGIAATPSAVRDVRGMAEDAGRAASEAANSAYQAKDAADNAAILATNAQTSANEAKDAAADATTVASSASNQAKDAKSSASLAITTADAANAFANQAKNIADEAKTNATLAQEAASTAGVIANRADKAASEANSAVKTANSNASSALTTANSALSTANTANTNANLATSKADQAKSTADAAINKIHVGTNAPSSNDTVFWLDTN